MHFGIDCAGTVTDTATLKAHGVEFVCRYVSPPGNAKNISKAEAGRITNAGLGLVLVWEENGDEPLQGLNRGVQDARLAVAEATACGMPHGSPLYFALDRDPSGFSTGQWASVEAYYKGVVSVLGHDASGAYGAYSLIKRLFDKKIVKYGWQTYAWSGGVWDVRAQLRQYLNGQQIGSLGVDFDHGTQPDYGQWRPPVPPKPQIKFYRIHHRDKKGQIKVAETKHPVRWQMRHFRVKTHGKLVQDPVKR